MIIMLKKDMIITIEGRLIWYIFIVKERLHYQNQINFLYCTTEYHRGNTIYPKFVK